MKIIKRGKLPESRIWQGECSNCKSVVEAEQKELKIESCQKEGTWGTAKCPVCGLNMFFHDKNN